MNLRLTLCLCLCLLLLGGGRVLSNNDIGYIETFSLAEDREKALEELIPGTEDYYYYHCLHYQNTGNRDAYDRFLAQYIKRHDYTARVEELRYRQALIDYDRSPTTSLEFIRKELGLHFNHHRQSENDNSRAPMRLDPIVLSTTTLLQRARHDYDNLRDIEPEGLRLLANVNLQPKERRDLLSRLQRPDYPKLVDLVVADLKAKHSGGFGSHPIHHKLLLAQLDALAERLPALRNHDAFVQAYLSKLRPGNDVDLDRNATEREAYYDRLWEFVSRLDPVHNSLKAHVLYNRLDHDRRLGRYDADRFNSYIQLPRPVFYVAPQWLKLFGNGVQADLNRTFNAIQLPPIGNEEPLVEEYLHHFLRDAPDYKAFTKYIRDTYLKNVFASTKIQHGIDDPEQWASLLSPTDYKALKERVDLDFAYTNPRTFLPGEPVALDLFIKNVDNLIIKVFEVNTLNYYRENLAEVNLAINLDGLVAFHEERIQYEESATRRNRRTFQFPQIQERGVYVVEFIGNGKSSRALVQKGRLHILDELTPAGHGITVLDEENQRVEGATIWLGGREFTPEEDGVILLPYSTHPGQEKLVIQHGRFASLAPLLHQAEDYQLTVRFHVDREALLKREKATVLMRPLLQVNGMPVSLDLLEEVRLVMESVDLQGISSRKEIKDVTLHTDRESTHEFQVPEGLLQVRFEVQATVQNVSRNEKEPLTATQTFSLNQIDTTAAVESLHVTWADDSYRLELLGKNGESKAGRALHAEFKHRFFRRPVHVALQTDHDGQCNLGRLENIQSFSVKGRDGKRLTWKPVRSRILYPSDIHASVGDVVRLPMSEDAMTPLQDISLLDDVAGRFTRDLHQSLVVSDGFLEIRDLEPGDYNLLIRPLQHQVRIRVTGGKKEWGYALSESRCLQIQNPTPLAIHSVDVGRKKVEITLANPKPDTRVHLVARRYLPEYDVFGSLHNHGFPGPAHGRLQDAQSLYVSGRNIGDEYRYILDRRFATPYPGNMLERPGLLLNPWSIRKTEAGAEALAEGDEYKDEIEELKRGKLSGERPADAIVQGEHYANLDFLLHPSSVVINLVPDENGVIRVDREALGNHSHLQVLALDSQNAVSRHISLPPQKLARRDLRLARGLNPDKHYAEQKLISVLSTNIPFSIEDVTTTEMETYDSVAKVFSLFTTLNGKTKLKDFAFIQHWPSLSDAEQRDRYSSHACHELSFFLYHKDPAFFAEVIEPYLRNKKDKTYLDHWLLNDNLDTYLNPWSFARLNIVERILLGRRIHEQHTSLARHASDLNDLLPPDLERFNRLFDTAVQTSALDADANFLAFSRVATDQLAARGLATLGKQKADLKGPLANREYESSPMPMAALATTDIDEARMEGFGDSSTTRKKVAEEEPRYAGRKEARKRQRRFFQKLDKTKEWVENNYYQIPIQEQTRDLVSVNAFWVDFANHDSSSGFLSPNLAEATHNVSEMMLALAVLDLPFKAATHEITTEMTRYKLAPGNPMVVFHKEVREGDMASDASPILVSQHFFRADDRYRHENNERFQKPVTEEFLPHVVYGCQVVLTNPTENRQKLNLLLQIPEGAIPVQTGFYTEGFHLTLQPYATRTQEYAFYFPEVGSYAQYPAHVAKDEQLLAHAESLTFNVVPQLSRIDTSSWAYLSQHGSSDEVLTYLHDHNIDRIHLADIAWRMKEKRYFEAVVGLVEARHAYNDVLWSYGIYHNVLPAAREFLMHSTYATQVGDFIDTPLLSVNPVTRFTYQHMEYTPLVNPRAHQIGRDRTILNHRFRSQYRHLMKVLSYKAELPQADRLAAAYYLFLQGRVGEGLAQFDAVSRERVTSQLQYDYMKAYASLYREDLTTARTLATQYAGHPVPRWQQRFANLANQLGELDGMGALTANDENRQQAQDQLAATEPSLELQVEAQEITVTYANLDACIVNYYPMDIELLFSRNPFIQQQSAQFSFIRPVQSDVKQLTEGESTMSIPLPEAFRNRNVMVEVVGNGVRRSQAYFANALAVQMIENYGQVKVLHKTHHTPLSTVYVKVYARMKDGTVKFFKDGYTDLRGRFDYVSLNTNEIADVDRLSILMLSKEHGAVIREAAPPKR